MKTPALAMALVSISILSGALVFAQQPAAPAAGRGAAAAQATPAAPPPGSPATYKSDAELMTALKAATERAAAGAQISAAFANTDQYRINVVKRTVGATPLAHAGNTELHHII